MSRRWPWQRLAGRVAGWRRDAGTGPDADGTGDLADDLAGQAGVGAGRRPGGGNGGERRSGRRAARAANQADQAASRVRDSLAALKDDPSIPPAIRQQLAADFAEVEAMLGKLERGDLHIAVFGRVSVGKSALLNALAGRQLFQVGVLHGTTRVQQLADWQQADGEQSDAGKVVLIDTPGIDELEGEAREQLAWEVAERADLVLFVVEGDLVHSEREALSRLLSWQRPVLLVLNKADRYSPEQAARLLERLRGHVQGRLAPENVVSASALPSPVLRVQAGAEGRPAGSRQARPPQVAQLQQRLLDVLEREGRTLAALNAGLFAGRLADQVAERVMGLRRKHAAKVIHSYCLAKGVAVALNPVPVADLVAAVGLDTALVVHLGRVYGMPLGRTEATRLIATISAQIAVLMAGIWGVHLGASALKAVSVGLSTVVTAGAQGALAWYATLIVGRTVEDYLRRGKSWGRDGAKRAVRDVVASLDRDSVLRQARSEILDRLKARTPR